MGRQRADRQANARIAELEQQLADLHRVVDSCIWISPHRKNGQPCIGGTRTPAAVVAHYLDAGYTAEHILAEYPHLTAEQVTLATWYRDTYASAAPKPKTARDTEQPGQHSTPDATPLRSSIMEKIPTAFVRDWDHDPKHVTRTPNPACAWVFAGAGEPTRKWDGTCVRYDGARWWARREVKADKPAPANFEAVSIDPETGKTMGWEPVEQSAFARWHREALDAEETTGWREGTYELAGPKINGNPEGLARHQLIAHAVAQTFDDVPLDYDGLAAWLHAHPYEGIVWHAKDGRMAKLKKRDFAQP